MENLSSELHDSSLLLPSSIENELYTLIRGFNNLYSPHNFIVGDEDLNLENILIPKIDCGRKNCKPIIIDPVLEFGPVPNLFYTYLADQRKGIGRSEEVKLVEEYVDLIREYELFKGGKSKLLASIALLFAVRNLETEIMFIKYATASKGEERIFFLKSISYFSKPSPLFNVIPSEIGSNVRNLLSYAKRLKEESLTVLG